MAITGSLLGQLEPANTTSTSIYSPASGVRARLTAITIVNTSSTDTARVRLFHDDDGSTFNSGTAVYLWDRPLAPSTALTIALGAYMNDETGNFGVRTDTAGIVTFTLYGMEET